MEKAVWLRGSTQTQKAEPLSSLFTGPVSTQQLVFFVYRALLLRNHTQEPQPHFVLAQLLQQSTINSAANKQKFISHSSTGWKSSHGAGMSGSGDSPPPGCRQLTSRCQKAEKECTSPLTSFLIEALNPFMKAPHYDLITAQVPPLPSTMALGIRSLNRNVGGWRAQSQSIAHLNLIR